MIDEADFTLGSDGATGGTDGERAKEATAGGGAGESQRGHGEEGRGGVRLVISISFVNLFEIYFTFIYMIRTNMKIPEVVILIACEP